MWSATVTSKSSSWDRGMARNNVLDQWRDTNITVLTVRWCIIATYHILIVVTIVIGLSCVWVTVSDQIFHGATECTRHWRETRWVNTDEEEKSVYKKKNKKPTSCWVIIRQADEWIAGTGLTVRETGGRDVVYHLVGLRWLHLHHYLKYINSVLESDWMIPGITWEAPSDSPSAGAGRSKCLCSQTGTPCAWQTYAWCSAPRTRSRPPSAALARRTWTAGRDPGILGWLPVVLLRMRKDRSVFEGLDL